MRGNCDKLKKHREGRLFPKVSRCKKKSKIALLRYRQGSGLSIGIPHDIEGMFLRRITQQMITGLRELDCDRLRAAVNPIRRT